MFACFFVTPQVARFSKHSEWKSTGYLWLTKQAMNTSIESLTLIVSSLQARIAELLERLAERDAKIASLQLIIEDLQKDNSDIRDRFNTNSRNSSKPPSSDGLSKPPAPISLRKKSGKKSGGQKGHAGSTLTQISNPNHVIRHSLHTCPGCGSSLENQECLRLSARQVFDIPVPETIVTEHKIEHKHCRKCKKTVRSSYPKTVEGPVQYGPNIRSWSVYLQNQHFIPEDRLQHLFLDLYGLSISTATLASYNAKAFNALKPFQDQTLALVQAAPVKHLDETGYRIEAKVGWLHVASTTTLTHYHTSFKRKSLLPDLKGTVVHDHWKPYFTLEGVKHGLCNQHHMRELIALMTQADPEPWAERMLKFFQVALRCRHRYGTKPIPTEKLNLLRALYHKHVALGIAWHEALTPLPQKRASKPKRRKGYNLLLRFRDFLEDTLRFMYEPEVPFTNNLAEQDLRMMKCKQKISGGFRTFQGAEFFARIRGFISTARKQKWNILDSLSAIFLPGCILPAPS